jgi:predicted 3-demethylubiquinone-9 3-methyltransferase (glyoxalase superfamily)
MQKISPHLWYDTQAANAARFYVRTFGDRSRILHEYQLHETPSGSVDVVAFELRGQRFDAISAGPLFTFTPAISFTVACKSAGEVDRLFATLGDGGEALMPLDEYPFSKRFGWTTDRWGLSWQLVLAGDYAYRHEITTTLLFVGDQAGKAEDAMKHYASVFPDGAMGGVARYPAGMEPEREGTVMHGAVFLAGQEFFAMDSSRRHEFTFNEAVSLMVHCDSQTEIDRYWSALSADPAAEQCGWLKDRYGVSWQITPTALDEMLRSGTPEQRERVTQAFLAMKKFDLAALRTAFGT